MQRIIVIGGGAVGLSSAYRLAEKGLSVSLLERHSHTGQECSFSNAAVLCPAHSRPKNLDVASIVKYSTQDHHAVNMEWKHLLTDPYWWKFSVCA